MLGGGIRKCKHCGKDGHTAFQCPSKPRKPLQSKKRLKKVGKLGKAYQSLREAYFAANPGEYHYCYYCLHVGIEIPLRKRNVQVEHFMSKARHPELRFKMSNLVASCRTHNRMKGSLDGPEFLKILDDKY